MSSTCDHGRSRLVLGAISLLLAFATAAVVSAPAADARKGWTKCTSRGDPSSTLKVQKISCKKAQSKVSRPYYKALFNQTSAVNWGRGCSRMDRTGNVCRFKVNGFKCTATNKTQWMIKVACAKEKKKKKQKVTWKYDRRIG